MEIKRIDNKIIIKINDIDFLERNNISEEIIKNYILQNIAFKEKFLEKQNDKLLIKNLKMLNDSSNFKSIDDKTINKLDEIANLKIISDLKNDVKLLKNNLVKNNPERKKELDLTFDSIEDKFIQAELFKMEQIQAGQIAKDINNSTNDLLSLKGIITENENYKSFIISNYLKLDNLNSQQKSKTFKPFKFKKNELNLKKWINKIFQIDVLENNIKHEINDINKEESMQTFLAKQAFNNLDPEKRIKK